VHLDGPDNQTLIHGTNSITGGNSALSVVFGWNVIIKYVQHRFCVKKQALISFRQLILHAR
jgi:hypothetical protein